MTTFKMPKSKRGAYRQYDALIRAYRRAFSGGGCFGYDVVTMRLNSPETYDRLKALNSLFPSLPE